MTQVIHFAILLIMNNTLEVLCPLCHNTVSTSANFCSQCGKKLKEPPLSTTVARQALIYCVSFFLAPFGLGYAFKYLKQRDPKTRAIGIVALVLTILAIVSVVFISKTFMDFFYGPLGALNF